MTTIAIKQPGLLTPWMWADYLGSENPVEIISYTITNEGGEDTIMVRMKPGDPTSIKEVPAQCISPFEPDRHPWFYRERVYYNDNPTAFIFKDELAYGRHLPIINSAERRAVPERAEVFTSEKRLEIQRILANCPPEDLNNMKRILAGRCEELTN